MTIIDYLCCAIYTFVTVQLIVIVTLIVLIKRQNRIEKDGDAK